MIAKSHTNTIFKFHGQSFNSTSLRYLKATFLENFLATCSLNESKIFLSVADSENREFTYSHLREDVLKTTTLILSQNTDAEVIAVSAHNSYEMIVFILATLVSGKTLYLLDPRENPNFYKNALQDLGKTYILFADDLLGKPAEAILMQLSDLPSTSAEILLSFVNPEQDFIYVRTSGSTGKSKIVRQSQSGVLANVDALIMHHQMHTEKVTIGTSLPLFHVNALEFSFLCTLFTGNKLVLWNYNQLRNLGHLIAKENIQVLSMIPTQIRQMIKYIDPISIRNRPSFKYIVSAAAPLASELARQVYEIFNLKIVQGYGLSEAVNFSCKIPINITDELFKKICIISKYPSIGIPVWGNEILVLDSNDQPLSEKKVGELCITGFNLMKGYLNDIPLGEEVPYFKTGDLGFFEVHNQQKFFFITGRNKDIAKRYGETIGLRDIDEEFSFLVSEDWDCISIAFPNINKGEEIGLICSSVQDPLLDNSFTQLINSMPAHRRPKIIFFNESLKLRTPSGKPKRWQYSKLFLKFEHKNIGTKTESFKITPGDL